MAERSLRHSAFAAVSEQPSCWQTVPVEPGASQNTTCEQPLVAGVTLSSELALDASTAGVSAESVDSGMALPEAESPPLVSVALDGFVGSTAHADTATNRINVWTV
jgi:hypothetical protein